MPNNPNKLDKKLSTHFGAGAVGTFAAAYAPELGKAIKRGAKNVKKKVKKTVSNIKQKVADKRNADGVKKMPRKK